ncbi:MAG: hypothetical protein K6G76_10905 [Lachnospiraceae bacterium]|nr:hypothetical protein [Lachnospiraceae bacterium]
MNRSNDNRIALSVVATLTSGIALVYTLITFQKQIFPVAGVSIIFLICAYLLTQNIVAFVNMKNKSLNVQIKNGMDDLSTQIEGMSSSQAQLGKATYLYTRQAAENLASLKGNYVDGQETLVKNLSVLANAQNKSTKLLIKYDQNNTTKLISTMKDLRNHLNETMTQGFDQIQPNNADVVSMLENIVEYLKSQPAGMDQSLSMQINNVAHELQNISSNIARVQAMPIPNMMQGMPAQPVYQEPTFMEEAPAMNEVPVTETIQAEAPVAEEMPVMEEAPIMEETPADVPVTDEIPTDIPIAEEAQVMEEVIPEATDEPVVMQGDIPVGPEEAAMDEAIAEMNAELAAEPEPVVEEAVEEAPAKEEPFTPTFTVVGKEEPEEPAAEPEIAEAAPEPATPTVGDVSDPNKQLSADEIAALFAAADPAPKKEEPAPEPVAPAPTPVSDDPNKQLSPDEIAALFASIG